VLNTAKVEAGESLAVFGCGGVGLNAVQGGRIANAYPLIAVDIADNKLEFARQMGATHTINSTREDAPARVRELTGRGADYTVVAAGVAQATEQAWASLAVGGTCVAISAGGPEVRIPSGSLSIPERTLKGSCYGSARPREDFQRLISLHLSGKLLLDELITKRYSIHEATEAFEDLEQGLLARGLIVFE
jgi:S-(hydroxymethyl)glutathione dehydrogenase/alcohol dehydrogenase